MAKRQKSEPTRETRRVAQLVPFPSQTDVYDSLPPHELQALADDIAENGLREPIVILPKNAAGFRENSILDGTQRLEAIKLLGWTRVPVLVRYDLTSASRAEVTRQFVSPNLRRRQLRPLQQARAVVFEYQTRQTYPLGRLADAQDPELHTLLAETLNVCHRHLKRVLRILDAPLSVQRACDAGKLKMVLAERVSNLSEDAQRVIAERIEAGEDPNAVVTEFLPPPDVDDSIEAAVQEFMYRLTDAMKFLGPRVAEVDQFSKPLTIPRHCQTIQEFTALLKDLKARLRRQGDTSGA